MVREPAWKPAIARRFRWQTETRVPHDGSDDTPLSDLRDRERLCGIAWNGVGVTCLQLPTKSAEAAERAVRRRAPGAVPGAPTPAIAEAVAAVKRYFEDEETDLDEQGAFFEQVYAAARRVGWGHTTTYGALAKELGAGTEAARDVGQARHAEFKGAATNCSPLAISAGGAPQVRSADTRNDDRN